MISLDNNTSERALRRPVVTLKNAYDSRTNDAARLAETIWTVTATAEQAGLNVLTYLTAYLDACDRNGAKPLPAQTCTDSRPGPHRPPTYTLPNWPFSALFRVTSIFSSKCEDWGTHRVCKNDRTQTLRQ